MKVPYSEGRAIHSTAPHPIDYSVLDQLRQLESPQISNLVSRLIANVLAQAPERIAAMPRNPAEQVWTASGRHARDLKSDSGNLGTCVLSVLCDELQVAGRVGDSTRCPLLMARVAATFADARTGFADVGGRENS